MKRGPGAPRHVLRTVTWMIAAVLAGLALLYLPPKGKSDPALLPAESWKRVISVLDDHSGESAALDEASKNRILKYLLAASSDRAVTEASKKFLYSIPTGEVLLRITEVPYWVDKHSEIDDTVYARKSITSKSNCKACHPGADLGSFEDKDISVPEE